MINKYCNEFGKMYKRFKDGESLLEIANDYLPIFDKEGLGILGIISYLEKYLEIDEFNSAKI